MDEKLRAELLARGDEDQQARMAPGSPPYRATPAEIAELMQVDEANTAWLTELTARRGWPGRTLAGEDGARAAWLLAQHADPKSQPAFLGLLRTAVAAGEASVTDLAYLEDRVRTHAGQPQLYGTQFIHDQQGLRPWTIEDPENLDQRRARAGLEPFAGYEALMQQRETGKS